MNKEVVIVSMARTPIVDSATSQFFINTKDNPFLDHKDMGRGFGYAVFGRVVARGLLEVDGFAGRCMMCRRGLTVWKMRGLETAWEGRQSLCQPPRI